MGTMFSPYAATLYIGGVAVGKVTNIASIRMDTPEIYSLPTSMDISGTLRVNIKNREMRKFRHWLRAHNQQSNNWRRNHGLPAIRRADNG